VRIDLHLHSSASDGDLEPAALVRAAAARGLHLIALTDHDTVAGLADATAAAAAVGIALVPGIEISAAHVGQELHLLGYDVRPDEPALLEFTRTAAARRTARLHEMIGRLAALGAPVTLDDVLATAGPRTGTLGRPHLARALLRRGHVASYEEAFARFLADGAPAFLPTAHVDPGAAIDVIHAAGGLAVWAHPPADTFERDLPALAEQGLDGVECLRPRTRPRDAARLARTARAHGLLVTGGSDWHGPADGPLGTFHVRADEVREFLEQRAAR